jgi:hypothetical protein
MLMRLLLALALGLILASPAAAATTEIQLAPGIDASSQRTVSFVKATYTITVSGTLTTHYGGNDCVYDFAYSKCNAGAPIRDGSGIVTSSPPSSITTGAQAFSDLANPYPAYRDDHVYTFTYASSESLDRAFWAKPNGHSFQTTEYGGGFTVKFEWEPPAATPTPTPDPCGGRRAVARAAQSCPVPPAPGCTSARAAAVNEVRVVAVQPDVQFHRAGGGDDDWCTVHKDTVLQQGDEISCDPDGAVTLQFADNSTVVVKNTTQLKIASFFTEGGVVRTEILLKMGEIAAQVNKSEATKSDFRIKEPTGTASVRGTLFSVAYDPGSKTGLLSVFDGVVEYDPVGPKLATVSLTAGQEIEVGMQSMSKIAALGKAGARGGINRSAGRDVALKAVAKGNGGCGVRTPRLNAYSVKPGKGGWLVSVKLIGKLKGTSKWLVTRKRAKPLNRLAKRVAKRCR